MDRLGVGILGLGTAGRLMIPALADHPHARLAALADTDRDAREQLAALHRVPACAGIEELLARPDDDAVYVATPTMLHSAHVKAAAAAGKHVLVEKPMAGSVADAARMVDAARRAGAVLMVGH